MATKPQPRYQPGEKIGGRYRVHKVLMGGMGEVYLCLDLEQNYPFALKTFQQRYLTDPQRLRKAFEQEVATWIALEKHPNIVRCFHMDTLANQPFMVLEWVAGEEGRGTDLRSWLRHGPLDLKLALQIVIDICHGLLHAQAKCPGLVHRDLKPENVLIAQGGLAKITDFGLAQIAQTAGLLLVDAGVTSDRAAQEHRQSMIGGQGITGTPAYMAPEQWHNEPLDVRTDIYALGCILYELLTGASPFPVTVPATTPNRDAVWLHTLQRAHEQAQVDRLPSGLPTALNDVVQYCLAKALSARYPDVASLLNHLTSLYQAAFHHPPLVRPAVAAFTVTDYTSRGATYASLGQRDKALADYTHALTLDSTFALAYNNRGMTYADLGQRDKALADYTHALTLDPAFAKAYNNRGATYADLGQRDQALADFTHVLTLDPAFAPAYYNRGNTYDALGQHDQALTDFTQALTIDPNYAQAYSSRGNTYAALGQRDKALADYTHALTLDPTYAPAYYNRGNTYASLGQRVAALADFTQTITLDPNLVLAYINRGNIYDDLGQRVAALADYTQAITLDPNLVLAYLNIGLLLGNQGRHAEALPYFEKAAQLGDPRGAQHAGQARQSLGMEPTSQVNSAQQAFDTFQQADSLAAMQKAVTRFPLLLQPDFIMVIEQVIAHQAPPEHRPALTQRLTWLRQIANTQPRSTP